VGISGHIHGFTAVDQAGHPLFPALIWADSRSKNEAREMRSFYNARRYPNPCEPVYTAPKLSWFKNNRGEEYAKTFKFLYPKDYIKYAICGSFSTEHTDASGSLLYDFENAGWDKDLAAAWDLDIDKLPEIASSYISCGLVTPEAAKRFSLPQGIPVTGGLADLAASLYGSNTGKDDLLAMISSSGQLLRYVDKAQLINGAHVFASDINEFYTLSSIPAAGLSLRWIKNVLNDGISFSEMDELSTQAAPCEILFAPYLQGTGSPHLDVGAPACFTGLREYHQRGDLIRAIMEGVVFAMKQAAESTKTPDNIYIAGGGGSSVTWRHIFADIFQRPVRYPTIGDLSSYGAALAALKMIGIDTAKITIEKSAVYPSPDRAEIYKKQYERFLKLYPVLQDIYAE
jgi:xylulokinase